jgi:membrane protein DedA with SNARE-associated domain
MEQQVLAWIAQYGYLAIFSLLVLGIVGLPVPDETLLTFTGYLVFQGHLSLPLAFLSALAGSASGITFSYLLGRYFGLTLIHRYGKYLRITEAHVEKAHAWFRRAGHWSLTFGYFIPGVRHLTAYAAGMSELEYPPVRAVRVCRRSALGEHLHRSGLPAGGAMEIGTGKYSPLPGRRHHRVCDSGGGLSGVA